MTDSECTYYCREVETNSCLKKLEDSDKSNPDKSSPPTETVLAESNRNYKILIEFDGSNPDPENKKKEKTFGQEPRNPDRKRDTLETIGRSLVLLWHSHRH